MRIAAARIRARLAAERGFTLVEVLVAISVLAVGVMSTISVFDGSRKLTSVGEKNQAASHVAEQEIEKIVANATYASLGLSAAPASSNDSRNPNYWVTDVGGTPSYKWNQDTQTEPLCVQTACGSGTVSPGPDNWTVGRVNAADSSSATRLSGQIFRYVTLADDPVTDCGNCTGTADYKRLTIALTVNGPNAPKDPIVISTLVSNPDAGPGAPGPSTP